MRAGSETLGRVMRWGADRPFVTDVVFAAAVAVVSVIGFYSADPSGSEQSPDLAGVAIIAAQATGLAFRRRAPFAAFAVVILATITFWVSDYPTNFDIFSLLAVYAITAHGGPDRRRVWGVVGAGVALMTVFAILGVLAPSEDLPPAAIFGILAIHITAAVAGEVVYERRQRISALEQRALRAEAERELAAREAVLQERARIARDLHDIVAHGMSVMVVQAGAAQRTVGADPDRATESLEQIQVTGRQALGEMRRLLGVLRDGDAPVELAPQPTLGDIDEIVRHSNEAGVPTQLVIDGDDPRPAAGHELTSYRIVQEALTNVIKHAGRPASAVVKITYQPERIRLEVTDDGDGATSRQVDEATGHGLIGMRERVELYGGEFHAGPRPGGGFRVAATIPLEPAGATG